MTSILLVIFCALYLFSQANAWIACGDNSHCMKIQQCPNLMSKIKQLDATNYTLHREFMMGHVLSLTCGFEGTSPKVCCSTEEGYEIIKSESDKCGSYNTDKVTVEDGAPAESESMNWLALLEYETHSGKKFGCGGVLISSRYVLTAAYCLNPYMNVNLTNVHLGMYSVSKVEDCKDNCNDTSIVVGIEEEIVHEEFSFFRGGFDFKDATYDIALLRLDREVEFPKICLPGKDAIKASLTAGWGAQLLEDEPLLNKKHFTMMTDVDKQSCNKEYQQTLGTDIVCSKARSQQSCITDVGGPLMAINEKGKVEVEGLLCPKFPLFCKQNSIPGTYTDVRKYMNWIYTHIRQ